jgi:hypothetical protein
MHRHSGEDDTNPDVRVEIERLRRTFNENRLGARRALVNQAERYMVQRVRLGIRQFVFELPLMNPDIGTSYSIDRERRFLCRYIQEQYGDIVHAIPRGRNGVLIQMR